jgi:hypothetical protein
MLFFTEIKMLFVKLQWKYKIPQTDKEILNKKNNAGGNTRPHFKLYCRGTVTKTSKY